MIPLMTWGLKLSQHMAHGTSLFAVAATGLAGAISYGPETVHFDMAAAVALCGMLSARWGARFTHVLSERTLKRALGGLMLAVAPIVPLKAYFMQQQEQKPIESYIDEEMSERQHGKQAGLNHSSSSDVTSSELLASPYHELSSRVIIPSCIGLFSGFLAGVFGVGGGVIVVPALTLASSLDGSSPMTHHEALGTSLAAMVLPAVVGTYTHAKAGNLAQRVAPALSLGALSGAYMGGRLALGLEESTLRWGFSGLLAVVGLRTIVKA